MQNRKLINAWAMYDWANSVYSLVITSTIFPIYYNAVTKAEDGSDIVSFLGWSVKNTALYSYALSFSFLLVSALSPFLSGIADYTGNKKRFMQMFAWLGSLSCMGLALFQSRSQLELGILLSVLASVGYAGSLVFYNAYLPEITTPDRYDRVSARGFSLGYIGSIILLVIILLALTPPAALWPADKLPDGWAGLVSRAGFLAVGIWWIGFAQITFRALPVRAARIPEGVNIRTQGFRELKKVWHKLKELHYTRNFLLAFFFYSLGVQTVMYMAASFADKELALPSDVLIPAILIIQLVAVGGAILFARVSAARGNIFSITTMILIWLVVCACVLLIGREDKNVALEFYGIAALVGLVMGGIQSLSRATYSKLLPETDDHASFFSFYDVTEKLSIVLGTLVFGLADTWVGMRYSVIPLMASFILGLVLLQTARSAKLKPLHT